MKQITVQAFGRLGFLGHLDAQFTSAVQVNAAGNSHGDTGGTFIPGAANINDLPRPRQETGLLGTTRVDTPTGQKAVQDLAPGDLVLDTNGREARVVHVIRAPATRNAICLRAPYFGLNQDLVIGTDHRIAVTSDAAEYLFGAETILVPGWAIKDGRRALHWDMAPRSALYQIQLDRAAALKVGNCAVESMPKTGQAIGKPLTDDEARCFAAEHRSGYQN